MPLPTNRTATPERGLTSPHRKVLLDEFGIPALW